MSQTRPCTSAEVEVAGLRLRIEAENQSDLDLVLRVVGTTPHLGDGADATIRLGTVQSKMPTVAPDFEGPYGDHWESDGRHMMWHHWGLTAEVDATGAQLGGPATGHRRWVAVRNTMLFVLARLFYERGRFVVHGAAVRKNDRAVLVVGDSGAGKSTLAYAGGRAGWSVLADDMVVVDPHGDRPTAQGIARVPSVPGQTVDPTAEAEPLPDDDRDRVELVGYELDPRPSIIGGVLLSAHSTTSCSLHRLTGPEIVETLVPAFVLSALERPVQDWFPVALSLARLPAARLELARSTDERLTAAAEHLDLFRRELDDAAVDHRP